jgi:hypothetical protein
MTAVQYRKYTLISRPEYDEKLGVWLPYASVARDVFGDADQSYYHQMRTSERASREKNKRYLSASLSLALGLTITCVCSNGWKLWTERWDEDSWRSGRESYRFTRTLRLLKVEEELNQLPDLFSRLSTQFFAASVPAFSASSKRENGSGELLTKWSRRVGFPSSFQLTLAVNFHFPLISS